MANNSVHSAMPATPETSNVVSIRVVNFACY